VLYHKRGFSKNKETIYRLGTARQLIKLLLTGWKRVVDVYPGGSLADKAVQGCNLPFFFQLANSKNFLTQAAIPRVHLSDQPPEFLLRGILQAIP
jgi:hypothetical protein